LLVISASAIGFDGGLFGGTIMAGVAMVLVTSIGALMPVWEREVRCYSASSLLPV